MSAKSKTFTPKQLARLPDPGYVIELIGPNQIDSVICIKNGQVKYCRDMWNGHGWTTLLWSCCPTHKQLAAASRGHGGSASLAWYATHADLLAAYPHIFTDARTKAPNDY